MQVGTSQGWSTIRVHRRQGFYRNRLVRYQVRIDGSPVGKIAQGETKNFVVPAGEHRVHITIDRFWTSRKIAVEVRDGETAEFTCRPGWGALLLLFNVLVPHRYITLTGPTITSQV